VRSSVRVLPARGARLVERLRSRRTTLLRRRAHPVLGRTRHRLRLRRRFVTELSCGGTLVRPRLRGRALRCEGGRRRVRLRELGDAVRSALHGDRIGRAPDRRLLLFLFFIEPGADGRVPLRHDPFFRLSFGTLRQRRYRDPT
jgi:hypothetical protein